MLSSEKQNTCYTPQHETRSNTSYPSPSDHRSSPIHPPSHPPSTDRTSPTAIFLPRRKNNPPPATVIHFTTSTIVARCLTRLLRRGLTLAVVFHHSSARHRQSGEGEEKDKGMRAARGATQGALKMFCSFGLSTSLLGILNAAVATLHNCGIFLFCWRVDCLSGLFSCAFFFLGLRIGFLKLLVL